MIAIYLDSLIEHMQLQNEWHKEKWLLNQSIINVNKKKEKTKEIKKILLWVHRLQRNALQKA